MHPPIERKTDPIRILIADDHEVVREGYISLLSGHEEYQFVGAAGSGQELLDLIPKLKPDLIITDIMMPILDGIAATKIIHEKYPDLPVIAFSVFGEETLVMKMLQAGARGFLLKSSPKSELLEAIKTIREDGNYFCHETTVLLAKLIGSSNLILKDQYPKIKFTQHDEDIIRYICEEKSNKEIAAVLGVNIRSVETSREKIQKKLGVKNTAGTVIYAIRTGIYKLSLLGLFFLPDYPALF